MIIKTKTSTVVSIKRPGAVPEMCRFNALHVVSSDGTNMEEHVQNKDTHISKKDIDASIDTAVTNTMGILRDGSDGGSLDPKYNTMQMIGHALDKSTTDLTKSIDNLQEELVQRTDSIVEQAEQNTKDVAVMRNEMDQFLQVAFVQTTLYWEHYNVRAIGERGTVEEQGFTQDGAIPITYIDKVVDGTPQTTICLPAPIDGGTALSNCARMSSLFDDSLWTDMEKYGATYSGVSMLGTEHMVNGSAGAFTGVLDRFRFGRPYARFVVAFKGMPGADGNSYVYVTSTATMHITENLLLDGTNGLPKVEVGEWFEWEITIPPNFTTATLMDIRINGVLIPPKLKYVITDFSGLGSCLKVGNWFVTPGGNYSYHTNIGVTIMQCSSHKVFTNDDLAGSDIFTIVTPEGLFNLTCEANDIEPLPIGHTLQIVAINKYGTLKFIGNSGFLINGIRTNTIPILKTTSLTGINISTSTNNYVMDLSTLALPQFSTGPSDNES